jgi:L1 cell adhesion molecule like protein
MPSNKKRSKKKKSANKKKNVGNSGVKNGNQGSAPVTLTQENAGILFSTPIVDPNADPVTDAEKRQRADRFKTLGNEAFKAKEYKKAVKAFSEAISWDTSNHVYFSNRSAAQIYCGKFKSALRDALKCVQLRPNWAKGYSRLGTAQFYLKKYGAAISALSKGLELDPSNQGMTTMLTKSEGLYAEQQAREAEKEAEQKSNGGDVVIGIDLGTTNSCVAIWRNETIEIIPNSEGRRTTPSIIGFLPDGQRIVGDAAKSQAASNPSNTVYDVKRLIGRCVNDHDVVKDVQRLPYEVTGGGEDGEKPTITVQYQEENHTFAPEELSAMVLRKMKQTAEAYLNQTVTKAVVTVPAYFNDSQRNATKTAGAIAGLEVLRIINEPTAAALAYGLDRGSKATGEGTAALATKETQNVLVFDLGGGTFDVSILSIEGGIFSVLSTGGDTHLGGEDFDDMIVDHFMEIIKRKFTPKEYEGIKSSKRAMRRLRTAGEEAKRMLSAAVSASVEVEDITPGKDFTYTLSRALFEKINAAFFNRTMATVDSVVTEAGISEEDINDIVLVGGSTRIPKIQAMLSARFGGKDLCKSINPDEAVAYGAAVQGAVLSGARDATTNSLLLVDVTPLSLGIETEGKVMSVLIKRNTPIPASHKKSYTTVHDYQQSVDIPIYEGERSCVDGNNLLGDFTISGIERAKKGVPKIVVSFDIDSNGILSVTARDDVTGSENSVQIKNRGRLDPEEIERMVKDAQKFEKEDAARLEVLEARADLESLIYSASEAVTSDRASAGLEKALSETQTWFEMVDASSVSLQEVNNYRMKLQRFLKVA